MAGKTILKKIVLILISALPAVFLSCANQLPPGGGPIDYTPPEIVSVYPESGTINFKDDHFEVTFSKYVDRRSAQDAIFISPPVEGTLEYDWSGKTLRVDFPSKLKDSVTYIVTFGTDLVDLNNRNRMAQAYSFSFSTGSQIDKGIISGRIYTKEPSGILLFAYPKTGAEINPVSEKPKYISQAGKNGDYKMLGLASGSYRVFAVKDEFRTFTYRIGDDLYGAPYTDVTLSERDTAFNNLDFFMTKEDTVKPRLVSATMTDRNHILIGFSEEIDSTMFNSNNFFIYDSTTSGGYKPLYAFQGRTKKTEMVLSVKTLLNEQDNVFLTVKKIGDLAGNTTLNDFARITVTAKPDTSAPKLFQTKPTDGAGDVEVNNPVFYFYFDDGFDSLQAAKGIWVTDKDGVRLTSEVNFLDDASFRVKVVGSLKTRMFYNINLNLNNFADAAGNKIDSVYKFRFSTSTGMEFSGVSGSVIPAANMKDENLVVVLQNTEEQKPTYKKRVNKKKTFDFNKVQPGKYVVWSFVDKDSSGVYNFGKPYPFKESGRFTFHPDTLNLRARWPISDVVVEYK